MADFTLYDVTATCRDCKAEYPSKTFSPEVVQRYGLCPKCAALSDERAKARQAVRDPLKGKPKVADLELPRRIWEPD